MLKITDEYIKHPSLGMLETCGHSSAGAPCNSWPSRRVCDAILSIVLFITINTKNAKKNESKWNDKLKCANEHYSYDDCAINLHSSEGMNPFELRGKKPGRAAVGCPLQSVTRLHDAALARI